MKQIRGFSENINSVKMRRQFKILDRLQRDSQRSLKPGGHNFNSFKQKQLALKKQLSSIKKRKTSGNCYIDLLRTDSLKKVMWSAHDPEVLNAIIEYWKINKGILAKRMCMPLGTFKNKLNPHQCKYKFTAHEYKMLRIILRELARDVRLFLTETWKISKTMLAERSGMSVSTLKNKLNTNQSKYNLTLFEYKILSRVLRDLARDIRSFLLHVSLKAK